MVPLYLIASIMSGYPLPLDSFIAANITVLLIISGVLTMGFGFVVLLVRGYKPFKYLEFRTMPIKHTTLMILMGASFAIFVNCLLTLIQIDRFLPDYVSEPIVEMITANLPLTFLAIGIIVPIYEEFLVRGLMFKELKGTIRLWPALLIQGLIFGLMHGNALQFSYAFPMGVFLGYAYIKFRSIWAPILIHLAWNSTSILMGVLLPEDISSWTFSILMAASGLLFVGCTVYSLMLPTSSSLKSSQGDEVIPHIRE